MWTDEDLRKASSDLIGLELRGNEERSYYYLGDVSACSPSSWKPWDPGREQQLAVCFAAVKRILDGRAGPGAEIRAWSDETRTAWGRATAWWWKDRRQALIDLLELVGYMPDPVVSVSVGPATA